MKWTATAFLITVSSLLNAQTFDRLKMVELLERVEDSNRGMGSVAISQNGEEVFFHSFGYERVEDDRKANRETIYRVGSLSKTFTAAIVLKLEEEGLLQTSDLLARYFPDIPNSQSIKLDQLLLHRSGLYNFTNQEDYSEWLTEEKSREQLLDLFSGYEPVFEPGSRTEYSNTNYLLLTFIAEYVTGKSFAELLEEYITGPLGLENTFVAEDLATTKGHAFSYNRGQNWERAPETHYSIPLGAGAMSSNVRDLNRFIAALLEGEILQKESLEKMTTITGSFGMGLVKIPFYEKYAWGHTGGIDGFFAVFSYFPEEEMAISAVFNGLATSGNDLLIGLLSIYFGKEYELPEFTEPLILAIEELEQYPGLYTSPQFPLDIQISRDGNILHGQATGQPSFPLEARGNHVFTFDQAGLELTFKPEEDLMILRQGGMEFRLSREVK